MSSLVVERYEAAPAAVVGAALRVRAEAVAGVPSRAEGWRYGWGRSGRLWRVPPPGAQQTQSPAVTTSHFFDLASLTKPAVGLLLARLERGGVLSRREPLGELLPALRPTPSAEVSLDLLAAHRGGLAAHREMFVQSRSAPQPRREVILEQAASARRQECGGPLPERGFPPVYSDLGYILLGAALEARAGEPLDQLVRREVAAPLGVSLGSPRQLTQRSRGIVQRIAPTEEVTWRGGVLRGVVHDENAWVLAGEGTAGHAGLFGDVWSVVRLGTAVLDAWHGRKDHWLSRAELEPVLRPRPGGSHCAGFDRRSGDRPSSGTLFGPATFGHLGFTGTSLWIDPERQLVGVLLTNRVHPSREHVAIREARPVAYDAIFRRMTAK